MENIYRLSTKWLKAPVNGLNMISNSCAGSVLAYLCPVVGRRVPASRLREGVQVPKARYEGIYRELRDRIQGGLYAYRDLLPTEKELTTEFSCSRNTLRRALSMLADEAFVQPIHGKGVRVIWRE